MYPGKQGNLASTDVTPTHGTILEMAQKTEGTGTKYS
jgi:hypothetical protein